MATKAEVAEAVTALVGAGLSFAPKRDDLPTAVNAWARALRNVPNDLLQTAVDDWIMEHAEFPKPAQIIDLAQKVKANNGQSIGGGWFKPDRPYENQDPTIIPGAYRRTPHGWQNMRVGEGTPIDWAALEKESAEIDAAHPPTLPLEFPNWEAAAAWMELQREA